MTPIGNARFPLPRRPLLSFLLASSAVMLCQSAFAQATASGGQTVEITTQQATCGGKICFQAYDEGSLLYSEAGTPVDVTVQQSWVDGPFYVGAQARDGGTIRFDGGGTFRVGSDAYGLWAGDPFHQVAAGTITANDLTFDLGAGSWGVGVNYGSTITLDGTTTMTAHGGATIGIEAYSGTITLNGPIQANGSWLPFALAHGAGNIVFNGGGTVSATGGTWVVFSLDGGRISMKNMAVRADTATNVGTDLLRSDWDRGTFSITDSTFEGTNTGGAINAFHASGNRNSTSLTLDNSQIKLNSAGTGIAVEGAHATVTLTRGSAITAFASNKGGLLAHITDRPAPGEILSPGILTLGAQDSTLSGNVQVEASGEAGANEFDLRLNGSALWRGNVMVGSGSRASVAIAGTSRWIGSASNATTVVLSSATALWAIPGGGNSTVTGTVRNAGKIAFQAGGPTTLTVRNFVNDGGTIQVNINAAGQNDFIHATGTATINGGTVSVIPATGTYTIGQTYKILTANGGITGQFSKVVDNAPFVDLGLSQNANNIYLKVTRNDTTFASVATNESQHAVADSVETLASGNALYQAVAKAPNVASARQAFSTLSGDVHASARSVLVQDSGLIRDAVLNRLYSADLDAIIPAAMLPGPTAYAGNMPAAAPAPFGSATPAALSGLWAQGFGSWGHLGGGGRDARIDHDTGGFLIGFDTLVQGSFLQDWRLGALAGYSHSSFDVDARAASGTADNYHVGLYAGRQWNALALRLGATYTWHDIDSDRAVALPGFADRLTTSYDAGTAQLFGELGYRIDTQAFRLEPFINAAYLNLHTDGFRETGGDAALTGRGDTSNLGFTTLGLRVATSFDLTEGTSATLQATLGWRHAFGDIRPTAALALANGSAFTASGTPIARDAVVVDTGISVALSHAASLGVSYSGQFGEKAIDQSVRGNFVWKF
ncbi:hypothetical protein C5L14_01700 [Labrys okinawensis]|uniref:Autotransporter domain-containing protein n=1 Tax=Labrys okinawensis TaxID=346911 RepID=A0A2S9QJ34_9HYPH|nr:autotransporter domain-containing protein [Labrys okinawensis]PRH89330.1 hypothetical protein C5L14_01700 [Labrys okinawensis]